MDKGIKLSLSLKLARYRACRARDYARANKAERENARLKRLIVDSGMRMGQGDIAYVPEFKALHAAARIAKKAGGR